MNPDEMQLLSGLFERIHALANTPRDQEAEDFIASAIRTEPHAPYVLSQTVILQEQALRAADARLHELETRIADLERQKAEPSQGFLGGIGATLFGAGRSASGVPVTRSSPAPQAASNPWNQNRAAPNPAPMPAPGYVSQAPTGFAPQAGGGFLSSALSTAAGVAGGALLFEGVSSLFRGGSGFGSGFMGAGLGNSGFGGTPVVNETIYETVNNFGPSPSDAGSVWGSVPLPPEPASSDSGFDAGIEEANLDSTDFDGSDFGGGSDDSGWA